MPNDQFKLGHGEEVIMFIRTHWIFLLRDVAGIVLLFLMPTVFIWLLQYFGLVPGFQIFGVSFYSLTDIVIYMWGMFCWLMIAERFTDYSLDFWVLTNKRLVESELKKLFDRKLATLELQDIEDITVESPGFFSNYFGYGNLEVQTAGAKNEFEQTQIANPEHVQQVIFDAKLKDEHERRSFLKDEVEAVAHQAVQKDVEPQFWSHPHFPDDQKVPQNIPVEQVKEEPKEFDWAHLNEQQKADKRNETENLEKVDDKYKKDVGSALRTE
jgi:hypothetical protein